MRTPEEVAREVLGCHVEVVEPGLPTSGTRYCGEHHYPWLHDVDMCPTQERKAKVIAEAFAEVRAETLAEFTREDVAPFVGHGFTDPGYWRFVGPKHYKPLPEPPTKAEARAICERFGITETEPNRDQEDR